MNTDRLLEEAALFLDVYANGFEDENFKADERYKMTLTRDIDFKGEKINLNGLFNEIDKYDTTDFINKLLHIVESIRMNDRNRTPILQQVMGDYRLYQNYFLPLLNSLANSESEDDKNSIKQIFSEISKNGFSNYNRINELWRNLVEYYLPEQNIISLPLPLFSVLLGVYKPNEEIIYKNESVSEFSRKVEYGQISTGINGYNNSKDFLKKIRKYFNETTFNIKNEKILKPNDLIDVQGFIWTLTGNRRPKVKNPKIRKKEISTMNNKDLTSLIRYKKQVILHGPPGTSKTHQALEIVKNELAREFKELEKKGIQDFMLKKYSNKEEIDNRNKEIDNRWEIVQFHPNYSYEDFVQGIVTEPTEHGINFKVKDKTFIKLCKNAEKDDQGNPYYLIIDEINRGEISKIFGELILGLEYRGMPIKTTYSASISNGAEAENEIKIPENLYIIGTMNTADKSIAFVDYALRRRFAFIEKKPDKNQIEEYYKENGNELNKDKIIELFKKINGKISEKDFQIGHTYFFATGKDHLDYKLDYEVQPLLDEYWKQNIIEEQVKAKELYRKIISDSNNENS